MYDHRNLSEVLSTVEINVAPATLIPFYDEDSSVVFLSAKVCKSIICQLYFCNQIKCRILGVFVGPLLFPRPS